MTHEDDKTWERLARQAETPRVPTSEAAQRIFESAGEEKLSEDAVASITKQVLAGELQRHRAKPAENAWLKSEEQRYVRDGVRQLNRNKGEDEDEDDELLDRLKSEALDDDEDAEPSDEH